MSHPSQLRLGFVDIQSKEDISFSAWKSFAKDIAEKEANPIARLRLAQAFCGSTLTGYWKDICKQNRCPWDIRTPPIPFEPLDSPAFTDLAVRWVRPGGIIGYVTPTSFLGRQYFKELRSLLLEEAPPVKMDFVTERQGIFEDVLQETVLSVYKRSGKIRRTVSVDFLRPNGNERQVTVLKAGKFALPTQGGEPWLLPREREHLALLKKVVSMPHRLRDYGFSISTGQLVRNRHKKQLKNDRGNGCYPLIWAESVTAEGSFNFSAVRRNHQPFLHVYAGQGYLVTKKPCILVQRTTAKEQKRRLIAALLPEEFIEKYGGVVVENHLNMIRSSEDKPGISPKVITAILNTKTLDFAFRCISGSVAVSAYELNALPMPSPEQMKALERLLELEAARDEIETTVARIYGVER